MENTHGNALMRKLLWDPISIFLLAKQSCCFE